MDQISKAAEFIADLRFALRREPQIPETFRPDSPASGYAVQEGVVDRLLKKTAAARLGPGKGHRSVAPHRPGLPRGPSQGQRCGETQRLRRCGSGPPLELPGLAGQSLCEQGKALKAGDLVSTGVCTDIYLEDPKPLVPMAKLASSHGNGDDGHAFYG